MYPYKQLYPYKGIPYKWLLLYNIYRFKIIIHIISSISILLFNNEWWMIIAKFQFVNIASFLLVSKRIKWKANILHGTWANLNMGPGQQREQYQAYLCFPHTHVRKMGTKYFQDQTKVDLGWDYHCNCWLLWIQTLWHYSLHTADWFSAIIIFHGPNYLTAKIKQKRHLLCTGCLPSCCN